jgi:acyl-CoA thioesterase FadM
VAAEDIPLALPRSLDPGGYADWPELGPGAVMMGPIRPAELDHTGALTSEELIRRIAATSHDYMSRAGFTPEWTAQTGINRMAVEFRLQRGRTPPAGTVLYGETRLASARGKSFCTVHRILTTDGEVVATNEQFLLAVDLTTRRAVEVPAFLLAAMDT